MLSAFVLGQDLLKPSASPVQPHLGSALGNPERAGHGGLREIVDVPQGQQLTVLRGQTANRTAHIHLQRQQIQPIGSGSVVQIAVVVEADRRGRARAVAEGLPADNSPQPRGGSIGNGSVPKAAPHPDHRLLGDVVGVVGSGDAPSLTQTPAGEAIPVQTGPKEEICIVMKRF